MTSPIARDAAERIRLNNEMTRGGYDSPHTTESIVGEALQSHLAQAIKESGAIEAISRHLDGYERASGTERVELWMNANDALLRLRALSGEAK